MTPTRAATPYGLAALAWALVIFWLSSAPRSLPEPLAVDGMDKLLHLGTFAVLAWLCGATLRRAAPEQAVRFHVVTAGVMALAYGLSDELHQAYVPGRQSSFYDVLADGAGALLGAALRARLDTV